MQLKTTAPANALTFESACNFESPGDRDVKTGLRKMPVKLLARTGNVVEHWYFGRIVHDMKGMRSKSRIALDYRHDPDEPIGFADKIEADTELRLGGELISRSPEDEAAKIMDLGPAGVPYESSIQFGGDVLFEWLPENMSTEVNGQSVTGPLTIVREWDLVRCAICLTGVDSGSQTSFSESGDNSAPINLKWSNSMSKEVDSKQLEKPAETDGKDTVSKETLEAKAAERAQFEQQFRGELKRYTDRFGLEGSKYFSDGLTFEQALDAHCKQLEETTKKVLADKEAVETKLAQLNIGELEGIDTGAKGKKNANAKSFEAMHKPAGMTAPATT